MISESLFISPFIISEQPYHTSGPILRTHENKNCEKISYNAVLDLVLAKRNGGKYGHLPDFKSSVMCVF